MELRIIATLFSAIISLLSVSSGSPLPEHVVPKELKIRTGTCFGPSFAVELIEQKLQWKREYYSEIEKRRIVLESQTETPTQEQWREFRKALDNLRVWQWHNHYEHLVCDGSGWSVELEYPDHSLKAEGSNGYPDEKGELAKDVDTTPQFLKFIASVEKLPGAKQVGYCWASGIQNLDDLMLFPFHHVVMVDATCSESVDFLRMKGQEFLKTLKHDPTAKLEFEYRFDQSRGRGVINYERRNVTFFTVFTDILSKFGLSYKILSPNRIAIIDVPAQKSAFK